MDMDSDYVVEEYIKPKKIRKPLVNDESADLLGNFDDKKRKEIETNPNVSSAIEEDPFASDSDSDGNSNEDDDDDGEEVVNNEEEGHSETAENDGTPEEAETPSDAKSKANKMKKKKKKEPTAIDAGPSNSGSGHLSNEQITALMKGASKQNRFVLYITNLNYDTSKERLCEFFQKVGEVKSVRIPKSRKTAFAFVEMDDISGFKVSV